MAKRRLRILAALCWQLGPAIAVFVWGLVTGRSPLFLWALILGGGGLASCWFLVPKPQKPTTCGTKSLKSYS